MLSSISESTIRQYSNTYKLWYEYCTTKNIPLYRASVKEVITFLQGLYSQGNHRYGTFNTHRSALSLILHSEVGNNSLLKRYLRGIARGRPQKPKYNHTWDPSLVLRYLELPANSGTLRALSHKTVTLLALITGGRLQTISLIRVSNIISREKEIQISITDPIKTTMSLRAQPYLHIPFFLANKNICPASTLMKYIDATKHLRQDEDFLFITYSGKHRRASKQTISRWVKSTLKEAGIDTAIFKPHSTRHSSTSAANRAGVSMEEICNTTGWSQGTSTFAKFYNRPLQETQRFAQAILISTQQEHT
nr:unnamed protein product [Callosobruchus analis]